MPYEGNLIYNYINESPIYGMLFVMPCYSNLLITPFEHFSVLKFKKEKFTNIFYIFGWKLWSQIDSSSIKIRSYGKEKKLHLGTRFCLGNGKVSNSLQVGSCQAQSPKGPRQFRRMASDHTRKHDYGSQTTPKNPVHPCLAIANREPTFSLSIIC